jgi:hypothetical protein
MVIFDFCFPSDSMLNLLEVLSVPSLRITFICPPLLSQLAPPSRKHYYLSLRRCHQFMSLSWQFSM